MRLLIVCVFIVILFACNTKSDNSATTTQVAPTTTPAKKKPTIVKAPVTINASNEKDYPPIVMELGFPVNPKAEVANIGNAVLDGDGVFMRLNIPDDIKAIEAYYDKEMAALGWTKGKLNVFKGADAALLYDKDGVVSKFIIINESDYRKVAVTFNRRKSLEELEQNR